MIITAPRQPVGSRPAFGSRSECAETYQYNTIFGVPAESSKVRRETEHHRPLARAYGNSNAVSQAHVFYERSTRFRTTTP